jgi:hypothetical protein
MSISILLTADSTSSTPRTVTPVDARNEISTLSPHKGTARQDSRFRRNRGGYQRGSTHPELCTWDLGAGRARGSVSSALDTHLSFSIAGRLPPSTCSRFCGVLALDTTRELCIEMPSQSVEGIPYLLWAICMHPMCTRNDRPLWTLETQWQRRQQVEQL